MNFFNSANNERFENLTSMIFALAHRIDELETRIANVNHVLLNKKIKQQAASRAHYLRSKNESAK